MNPHDVQASNLTDSAGPASYRWSRQELLAAMANREFVPYFQPKISLATGNADSVEILARWVHPCAGLLPSGQFIARMNEEDLSGNLSFAMLAMAIESARHWLDRGCALSLALNLPARSLREPGIAQRPLERISAAGIQAQAVMLELGDISSVEGSVGVRDAVTRLQRAGFRLSLNVGGDAPAALLARNAWRFCELKIDVSALRRMNQSAATRPMLDALLAMAMQLDMRTLVQGIETATDLALAKAFSCSFGQGCFLAEPMNEHQLIEWHAAQASRARRDPAN